jgi:hypothetical protein
MGVEQIATDRLEKEMASKAQARAVRAETLSAAG